MGNANPAGTVNTKPVEKGMGGKMERLVSMQT